MHTYIHTYIHKLHTYINYIHTYTTYIHTHIHTYTHICVARGPLAQASVPGIGGQAGPISKQTKTAAAGAETKHSKGGDGASDIHAHTYMHTYIHYMHTYVACMHTCMHTCSRNTLTRVSNDIVAQGDAILSGGHFCWART